MAAQIERLRTALADRYDVERELGRGGMATVHLARERESGRLVAIKVLHPELAEALGAERFRREIAIEFRLHHPHILGIIDSGEAGGLLYYVMPYVPGESVRSRLDREGQLPVEEAVRIAAEAAEALDYAHSQGVLHRDVKPENILLDDGRVLVADFGIARGLSDEVGQRLTQTGVTLGTPIYMSPEQSFAERDLDGRSDLYSLGCVLYEMLAGTPPFTGPSAQAITARHHMEAVPSITVVRPSVSDELEDLVLCALAKSRADRCTTREFAARLRGFLAAGKSTERRTAATRRFDATRTGGRRTGDPRARRIRVAALAAAGAVAALGGAFWAWRDSAAPQSATAAELRDGGRIAVLYLRDQSAGGRLGYLADGLTETLIDVLGRADVNVVSRDGVLPFRGTGAARDSIAEALGGVSLLVDGVVEERGGRANVSVTLWDGRGGGSIESQTFDFPADSALALQDSVVARLEAYLRPSIGGQLVLQRQRASSGSDAAWTLVQRAQSARKRAESRWEAGDTVTAVRLLGEADSLAAGAAAIAPRWALPPVVRGQLAYRRAAMNRAPAVAGPWLDSTLRHADAALAVAPGDADALELRGGATYDRVRMGVVTDSAGVRRLVDAAARDLRRAAEAPGASATAWVRLSDVSYRQLNVLEANRAAQRAYERDAYLTSAPAVLYRLFVTSYDLDQPQDAASWCETGVRRFPDDVRFRRCRLMLMSMVGARPDLPLAWRLLAEIEEDTPVPSRPFSTRLDRIYLAAALGRAGLADSARRVLVAARADRTVDPRGELRGYEAFARLVVGDRDEALALLEAYLHDNPEHREGFGKINSWWWRDLKPDPRFQQLLAGRG